MKTQSVKFHPKQVEYLRKSFPQQTIGPDDTMQKIYYEAGIAKVLEFVATNALGADDHEPKTGV